VWKAPVVFLVQNNGYAISVPLSKQTAAPSLAHKAIGYGMPGLLIDGNDAAQVHSTLTAALDAARRGHGPTLIEAVTYRMEAHTNADDATRYRSSAEVQQWLARDPLARLETYLRTTGALDDEAAAAVAAEAEAFADSVRTRMNVDVSPPPDDLFEHVYATPTPALRHQREQLRSELS
jgi:pyruvate dehydrogenase E1 component alpha subunit